MPFILHSTFFIPHSSFRILQRRQAAKFVEIHDEVNSPDAAGSEGGRQYRLGSPPPVPDDARLSVAVRRAKHEVMRSADQGEDEAGHLGRAVNRPERRL